MSKTTSKTSKATLASVNKAFAAHGHDERLARVGEHIFFVDGTASAWQTSSADVCRVSHLSVEQWLACLRSLKGEYLAECAESDGAMSFFAARYSKR